MSRHVIGDERTRGSSGRDNRMFVEAVLWIVRTGSPWRDLPDEFGSWNSAFRRFSRWSAKDIWHRVFAAMADDGEFKYLIIDSTIVRAHQHAAGAKRGLKIRPFAGTGPEHQDPPGRARARLSNRLPADRRHRGDVPQAAGLIDGLKARVVLADAAYDADHFREVIAAMDAEAVIPTIPREPPNMPSIASSTRSATSSNACFSKLKQFRRVATRYEKTAPNYSAVVTIAATILSLR